MASYKRQYLNLYAPGNADSSKFCVQQKADECYLSREDKKLRFYAPDFVIRKKLATAIDEEDLSVFDEFEAQQAEYTGFNTARANDHSVLATTVAALQVTFTVSPNRRFCGGPRVSALACCLESGCVCMKTV